MDTTEKELLSKLEKKYADSVSFYTKKLESVRNLLADESVSLQLEEPKSEIAKSKLTLPAEFTLELTQKQQVLFALRKIGGEGFAGNVAVELQRLNPKLSMEAAIRLATQKLSELNINDKALSYTSVGTKHKYKIKGAV